MKLRIMSGLLGIAWLSTACSGEGGELGDVATLEEELNLLAKPGTDAASFTEAGQDIERLGAYTFYSANADGHSSSSFEGSVHLFKSGAAHRSYQARNIFPGSRMGFFVGMSENWLATNVKGFPSVPGVFKDAVMIVGKDSSGDFASCGAIGAAGELPNCITCEVGPDLGDGQPAFARLTCAPKSGIQMIRPAAFSGSEHVNQVELVGNELIVPSSQKIALLKHNGSSWVESSPLLVPSGETFTGPVSLSGNRLAVSASGLTSAGHVIVYSRTSASSAWQIESRVHPSNANAGSFGLKLDLSGNSLVVTDSSSTHFFDLVAGTPTNPNEGASRSCVLASTSSDVSVSGSNVVLASSSGMAQTYRRGTEWVFQGGLPSGIFPRDVNPSTNTPTTQTMWGAAVAGDQAAIGWRNYRGTNPATETGAGLEFSFKDYDCGTLFNTPHGELRARDLTVQGASAPQYSFYQFPVGNSIDGNSGTRWMAPTTPGTKIDFALGELRMLSHLKIDWGTTYGDVYNIQVTENGTTWITIQQVTNGSGGVEIVDLSANPQAFGKAIRLVLNGFEMVQGSGDWGVAIREFQAFGRVHDSCDDAPELSCTGAAPSHVCTSACGGSAPGFSCYCDSACAQYGDCCSFDGANKGSEYVSGVADICDFDY